MTIEKGEAGGEAAAFPPESQPDDEPIGESGADLEEAHVDPPAAAPVAAAEVPVGVEPAEPPVAPERKWWSFPLKVVSVLVAVVGAATGVISVLPILFPDSSSIGTLTLAAEPDDSGPPEYALPLSDSGSGFPTAEEPCSAEQIAWLDEHAMPLQRQYMIDMRNTAGDGAMLALIDFRAAGESQPDPATNILVVCPADSESATVRAAALQVDDRSATARFSPVATAQAAPDVPVSWNLAPGETGRFQLILRASHGTAGTLEATALIGSDEETVQVVGSDFELPGLWQAGATYLRVGVGGLECVRDASGGAEACADAELAELELARSQG